MIPNYMTSSCGKVTAICVGALARVAGRLRHDRRGAAAVEFALMTPFLLGLLVPIADLGAYVYNSMELQLAAQAGAEYAARHDWDPNGILSAMQNAAPNLKLSTSDTGVPNNTDLLPSPFDAGHVQACGCVDPTTGNMTTVACSNPRPTCTGGSQLQSGVYYTVGAQLRYQTVSGLQYPFIANNTLMTAIATVRVQ
jgi:Flp pilus assembly protein TadG